MTPAEAEAPIESSSVVSSMYSTRYFGDDFLVTDFEVDGLCEGAVGVGILGVFVELGVPTRVGVLAVLVVVSFLLLRVAIIAQVIPVIKIIKAIIKANLTVLDMNYSINASWLKSRIRKSQKSNLGAGSGNRTRVSSLEARYFAIKLYPRKFTPLTGVFSQN